MSAMFFDSWGALWVTCDSTHPQAEAFGPRGSARRVLACELPAVGLPLSAGVQPWATGLSSWAEAYLLGRVIPASDTHEWDLLAPCPTSKTEV